ncbi:hypothetical protein AB6A40_000006 [Gnathostoma spinigerum]|uniref:Uncharacterized protein n=1 Tax=Gnathostoma spinigerum TaxID=75299 RepID=A0ABD6EA06_9BILA
MHTLLNKIKQTAWPRFGWFRIERCSVLKNTLLIPSHQCRHIVIIDISLAVHVLLLSRIIDKLALNRCGACNYTSFFHNIIPLFDHKDIGVADIDDANLDNVDDAENVDDIDDAF